MTTAIICTVTLVLSIGIIYVRPLPIVKVRVKVIEHLGCEYLVNGER